MSHAWLIIAHNEFEVLQRLIDSLDAAESDFYVHIDKKVKELPLLKITKGRLFMLQDRVDVHWGHYSQIQCELLLLETALSGGPYSHYHILSGTHLPLKPLDELLVFYDSHKGEEIMRIWDADEGDADFKLRRYHFPIRYFKSSDRPVRQRLDNWAWRLNLKVQKTFGIRHHCGETFRKTDNWLSLSEKACAYLVSHKQEILKKYRRSFCGDEYFVATELGKLPEFRILDCKNLLHVEFQGDTPRTFHTNSLPRLRATGCYWARKFSSVYGD